MRNIKNAEHKVNIYVANGHMTTNRIGQINIVCQNKKINIDEFIVSDLKHKLFAISKLAD